ncbi:MAG: hypothetical protein LBU88_06140 [Treponema sp.]|jgi:hypothetical protein|nr:hypothetical protein [Treponema sp.]
MAEAITETRVVEVSPRVLEIFRKEAQRAVVTLRETAANGDIKLFTITVHSMKSAFSNVNEKERAEAAGALEDAGRKGDLDFISANAENFIKSLEEYFK